MSRFGLGFVSGSGGNDLFTKSLLHFDGTNGSTTITDTAFGKTPVLSWSAVGCALNTGTIKFGASSLSLSASPQYVTTPSDAAFNSLGTTPFVFDLWVNPSSFGSARAVAGIGFQGSTFSFTVVRDAGNTFSFIVPGATATTGAVSSSGWHHLAFIADGSKIYAALDGAVSAGVSYSSLPATSGPFDIGDFHVTSGSVSTGFIGFIDEARLSIGTTRGWTANFTPPAAAYS